MTDFLDDDFGLPKLKIDYGCTIETERPQVQPTKKFDWIQYSADKDIAEAEKALDSVKSMVSDLRRRYADAAKQVRDISDEKWKDRQLEQLKAERDQAVRDSQRGFPITEQELQAIHKWQQEHDTNVHNNPKQYHGASGGGYSFVFYPTGLGTAGDCICSSCKSRAIREAGALWYDKLKELGGIFEFQELG